MALCFPDLEHRPPGCPHLTGLYGLTLLKVNNSASVTLLPLWVNRRRYVGMEGKLSLILFRDEFHYQCR